MQAENGAGGVDCDPVAAADGGAFDCGGELVVVNVWT